MSVDLVQKRLEEIQSEVNDCRKCSLYQTRNKTVLGQGSLRPEIMFIGEAPGADEDRQGCPFVGKAGMLLNKMIEAMGLTKEDVYIGNILKCRPPGNRTPAFDEMDKCLGFLEEQIDLLQPEVIITLGKTAVQGLLGEKSIYITKIRGNWMKYKGINLMPTFHPSFLLRPPLDQQRERKRQVWTDLKQVLSFLGKEPPRK